MKIFYFFFKENILSSSLHGLLSFIVPENFALFNGLCWYFIDLPNLIFIINSISYGAILMLCR